MKVSKKIPFIISFDEKGKFQVNMDQTGLVDQSKINVDCLTLNQMSVSVNGDEVWAEIKGGVKKESSQTN